ncbi:MAG: LysR family transcriptional regulator [Azoarcus sp.]|nr:LysR family transcriptional regulator [Azoarcus sp.]MDD2872538.1 LysR family transcriptional regulator [Azoarcus sp.]MDX9837365.1 LysR family transcriptional regulator [Azoarcus sp.]
MRKSTDQKLQWEDVRYFLALTREGSLSGAARKLVVEHSTVARRVESLEQAIGLRLFDRLPRGWQLTAEGEGLVGLAERMEDEAFAFERAAIGTGSLSGTVRVSLPPSLANVFLVPRIAARHADWSGITLELVGDLREVNLSRREADVAVRLGRPQDPGLVVRSLGKIGFGLYAHADYVRTHDERDWTFIGLDDSLRHLPHQIWLERYAGQRSFVLRSNDQIALLGAARAGLGVACLAHYLAESDTSLARVPTAEPVPAREIWLVLHADVRRSPRVRVIADLITSLCEESAGFLTGPR